VSTHAARIITSLHPSSRTFHVGPLAATGFNGSTSLQEKSKEKGVVDFIRLSFKMYFYGV